MSLNDGLLQLGMYQKLKKLEIDFSISMVQGLKSITVEAVGSLH